MSQTRFAKRGALLLAAALLSLTLTGCIARLGTAWAGLTVLEDGTSLVYVHESNLAIVDIANDGKPLTLVDDRGETLIDETGVPAEWRVKGNSLENAQFFAAPLQLDEETLLVAAQDGRLFRVDLPTSSVFNPEGVLIHERTNVVTDLVRVNNLVLVGTSRSLTAVDAENQETVWTIATGHAVWAAPLVVDNVIYFVSLDHFIYAADVATGEVIWKRDLGGASAGKPAYDAGTERLYVGTFDRKILALDASTGDIAAAYETDEWVWGAPVLVEEPGGGQMLYAADLDGMVYKLDPDTLTEDGGWKVQVANGAIRTPPVVFGDYVVVGSRDQNVYWLRRDTGTQERTRQLDGEILAEILYFPADDVDALDEDLLVVSALSKNDALVGFEAQSGERLWTFK